MMKTNLRAALVLLIMSACVGCDQATKLVARAHLPLHATISLFHDTLRLERTQNPGAFLGLGEGLPSLGRLIALTLGGAILLAGVAWWTLRSTRIRPVQVVGAGLICGGGLANLIDRLAASGNVTDFLNVGVGPLRTGIFNVADMALMLGVAILIAADGAAWRLRG